MIVFLMYAMSERDRIFLDHIGRLQNFDAKPEKFLNVAMWRDFRKSESKVNSFWTKWRIGVKDAK